MYPQIVRIVSHISHVVMFDSGGAAPPPRARSSDETENRDVFGGSTGDGAGDGERDGTCTAVTAS